MPNDSVAPDYGLSQTVAATLLKCAPKTVERYLNAGKLRSFGAGERRKVSATSVAEYLGVPLEALPVKKRPQKPRAFTKESTMTVADHLALARQLGGAMGAVNEVEAVIQEKFPKGHPAWKAAGHLAHGGFTELRSVLDDDYHRIATDAEFAELGHIYYRDQGRAAGAPADPPVDPITL